VDKIAETKDARCELELIRKHARHLVFLAFWFISVEAFFRASGHAELLAPHQRMSDIMAKVGFIPIVTGSLLLGGLHFWILTSRAIARLKKSE